MKLFRIAGLLISIALLSSCQSAPPTTNGITQESCVTKLKLPAKPSDKDLFEAILKKSLATADKNGLVETYYEFGDKASVQVYDPSRSDTIALGYWDYQEDTYEGFYEINWMTLYGYEADIRKANKANFKQTSENKFKVNFSSSKKKKLNKEFSIKDCLITYVGYSYDGSEWSAAFQYEVTDVGTMILNQVWDQIGWDDSSNGASILDYENYAVGADQEISEFPNSLSGFELYSQSDTLKSRLFQGDKYWVPIEEYQFSTLNSCEYEYWVIRWKSYNPDVTIKLNVGSVMVEDFMTGTDTQEGVRGYAAGYGCYAPGLKFGETLTNSGSTLVDIYYEYQIWREDPSI